MFKQKTAYEMRISDWSSDVCSSDLSWAGWISEFLIGRPSGIWKIFVMMMSDGSLLVDSGYTLYEAMLGFVVGTALGSVMGLAMWYSVFIARVVEPFIVAMNSVPQLDRDSVW